jgi:RNA polymerase sigma-70 factor (ECF subfamily)
MTGSVIDGEDVVQDALLKAAAALAKARPPVNLESWLFRIAHNSAVDFLRRRARAEAGRSNEDPDMLGDLERPVDDPAIVAASMQTFMRLPASQRSAVILMDVLGYRLNEICGIVEQSLPAVKSALHRGRMRLRELAREPEDNPAPLLPEPSRSLLAAYVERFNARDFDAVRDMLASEVALDLVNNKRLNGKARVATYFHNYALAQDWKVGLGLVDGDPAIVVLERAASSAPLYFIVLEWQAGQVRAIRDFRYARYAMEGARITLLP